MKYFFSHLRGAVLLLALPTAALAQTGVTIGANTAPDASAALDIISTSKGVLLPRVALATGVANPATGLIVYQTGGTPGYYYNAGTSGSPSWQQIATAAGAAVTASNGLTKTGQNLALGGTLTQATTIAQGGNAFSLTGGNVGIGTSSPVQRLHVAGNALITGLAGTTTQLIQADASGNLGLAPSLFPASASTPTLASTTSGLNNPLVAVSGTLAVVLNRGANSLSLYDLTNPASPVLRGTLTDATNLANGVEVAISGSTAAVLCNTLNGNSGTGSGATNDIGLVRLFTLGATAPVLVNTLIPPAALSAVNGGLAMSGTKLYVVYDRGASSGYFYVYDVTNPATTPTTPQGTGFPAGGYFTPQSLAAFGNFVAVGSLYNGASILNVSNPAAPVVAGGTGVTVYTGGNDCPVALNATTLCVLHPTAPTLNTYTVSATGVPSLRNTFTTAASPVSVALNGSLALVACRVAGANVLQVIDVSGSTAVLRHTIALTATTNNVVLTPTLALVANGSAANNLQIFNTPFGARTVVVGPDGTLTSTPPAAGVDYVQNQTATAQTAGFNVSGNGTVGGLLAAGTASVAGALTGTGSSISGVGVGIRADGGLNLGQNAAGVGVYLGYQAGQAVSTGAQNTLVGYQAGAATTSGGYNLFVGFQSGYANTASSFNQFMGYQSGLANTSGSNNYFGGYQSGYSNTTGSRNYFSGNGAGAANTTGSNNHFVGYQSGAANTTGTFNHFDGYWSGLANTTGDNNYFVGHQSGLANTTGSFNHFSGLQSGTANTTGVYNQFEGYQSGLANTIGTGNMFSGYGSGLASTTGSANVFNGMASGLANTTGSDNVFVGFQAGRFNLTGSRNVAVGREAGPTADGLSNTAAIGYQAVVSQSNSLVLGGTGPNALNVGIGTTAPAKRLHVNANNDVLRIDNLAQVSATNSYLVIDNSGNVGKTVVENVAGQLIRLGFNGITYSENNTNSDLAEAGLRFNAFANTTDMGVAPNGAPNFINTITGATISTNQGLSGGNGTPSRTTDRIALPAGVYRVTVRLAGAYVGANGSPSAFVKFVVDNNEYSFTNTLAPAGSGINTHAEVSDYINLSAASTIDFTFRPLRNFTVDGRGTPPGTGYSYRSLLLIERVR